MLRMSFFKKLFKKSNTNYNRIDVKQIIHTVYPFENKLDGNAQVLAEAWRILTERDTYEYGVTAYTGSTSLTMIEVSAAKYWQQQLDLQMVKREQVIRWIREIERDTGDKYIYLGEGEGLNPSDMAFMYAVAKLSLNFSATETAMDKYPESLRLILTNCGKPDADGSERLEQYIKEGQMNSIFLHFLSRACAEELNS